MNLLRRNIVFIISLGVLSSYPFQRDTVAYGQDSKILFLNLRWENDSITLRNFKVSPGRLKVKKFDNPNFDFIIYEMFSSKNKKLGEGSFSNPTYLRYEHEDPANPGKIKSFQKKLDKVNFTLRVPFVDDLNRVDFYRGKIHIKRKGDEVETTSIKAQKIGTVYIK